MKRIIVATALFAVAIGASAQEYEYATHASGESWDQCEYSRESAQQWAEVNLKNTANDECRDRGDGWRFSEIKFSGYQQAIACEDGKTWKYEITDAVVECKRLAR